jgi:hypothetical protein
MRTVEQTNTWLRDNGIKPKQFSDWDIDTNLLQAQKIAHNLLKHHAKLLGQNEAATLNSFLVAMSSPRTRRKLTKASCYKVMNIGTSVNRKLFKQHKNIGK